MDPALEQEHLNRFGELVLADAVLHDRLRAAPTPQEFAELAVQLGAERGCAFRVQTVQERVQQKRREWLERWI
jgi:hypothetical protein